MSIKSPRLGGANIANLDLERERPILDILSLRKEFSERAVNVKWFGAKGDGVTDDTAAIQAALDEAASAGGGTVCVPPGVYLITGVTISGNNVSLMGCGKASQLLVNSDNPATVLSGCSDVVIRGLYLRNTGTPSSYAASGIRDLALQPTSRVAIIDVEIEGFWHGVRNAVTSADWILINVWSHNNAFTGFMGCGTRQKMVGCAATNNGTTRFHHGVYGDALEDQTLEGLEIIGGVYSDNAGDGITIFSGNDNATIRDLVICGAYLNGNGVSLPVEATHAISVGSYGVGGIAQNIIIANNVIASQLGTAGIGIWVGHNSRSVTVAGNAVRNCAGPLIEVSGNNVFGVTVKANICENSSGVGILCAAPDCVLEGNILRGPGTHAIHVTQPRNAIVGNSVDSSWTNDGVRIENGACIVNGNSLNGRPIRITIGDSNIVTSNHTNGGGIVDNGTGTIKASNV